MPTIISEWIYCPVCGNKTNPENCENRTAQKPFPIWGTVQP